MNMLGVRQILNDSKNVQSYIQITEKCTKVFENSEII